MAEIVARRRKVVTMQARRVVCLLLAAVGAGAAGCGPGISREGRAVLREGTRVEVFRVAQKPLRSPTGEPVIGRHPVLAQGKDLGADFAARLADSVLGHPVLEMKCGIQPGVAFRVWRGDQCVEVLVCFQCNVLAMHLGSGDWGWTSDMLRDFTGGRARLLALCKEALPDDPVIQRLPDVRPKEWPDDPPATQRTVTSAATTAEPGTPPALGSK
jgi:hypothetical protein